MRRQVTSLRFYSACITVAVCFFSSNVTLGLTSAAPAGGGEQPVTKFDESDPKSPTKNQVVEEEKMTPESTDAGQEIGSGNGSIMSGPYARSSPYVMQQAQSFADKAAYQHSKVDLAQQIGLITPTQALKILSQMGQTASSSYNRATSAAPLLLPPPLENSVRVPTAISVTPEETQLITATLSAQPLSAEMQGSKSPLQQISSQPPETLHEEIANPAVMRNQAFCPVRARVTESTQKIKI
jgi:hypothetical protein